MVFCFVLCRRRPTTRKKYQQWILREKKREEGRLVETIIIETQ